MQTNTLDLNKFDKDSSKFMTFQEIISQLQQFWADQGCLIQQPCDIEVGAGTFNPATFLRCLGPEPWQVAYVEPCRRPTDGRYGENPFRWGAYYQYQVLLKPAPTDVQYLYLESLKSLGIDPRKHDFRFVEDDWESPTLGASGLGWEVWWNGAEITQFTYFQQMGSLELNPISAELTYGLERIALYLQDVSSFHEIQWNKRLKYGDVHYEAEVEYSKYNFDYANTSMLLSLFDTYEAEAFSCLDKDLILPATDYVLKSSHTFNLLDARGVISVTERVGYIERVRRLAQKTARAYVTQRQNLNHPLLISPDSVTIDADVEITTDEIIANDSSKKSDFLLEIGTEEIPASYIQPALEQLNDLVRSTLVENRLLFEELKVFATPRRLTLAIKSIDLCQADQETEVIGPPMKAAFDDDGNPTSAAIGFAKSNAISVESLQVVTTNRGEYVSATKSEIGRKTFEILTGLVPDWIHRLNFPKTMRWDDSRFARPIRWLVVLLGKDIIPVKLDRLTASRLTYGHRSLNPEPIHLSSSDLNSYIEQLRLANVLVDQTQRYADIQKKVELILAEEKCSTVLDQELLTEINYLVENPQAIVGTFDSEHLELPIEVLTTYMKKHQRYFPMLKEDGTPIAKFITISNGSEGNPSVIRQGNERVLRSRLEDATFYYKEDRKSTLADKANQLKNVIFQVKLGSLHEKSKRLQKVANSIVEQLDDISLNEKKCIQRTAELCKADLTTQMVIGFPSLQGTMGKYYALASGESNDVALAIEQHYRPISSEGSLPESRIGMIVSIADKMDTIVGYFGIDERPTSSQDPYSLRRQAIGILRILQYYQLPIDLHSVIDQSVASYLDNEIEFAEDTKVAVANFLKGRFQVLLQDQGFAHDEVNSTLSVLDTKHKFDVSDVEKRAQLIQAFRKRDDFDQVYSSLNRVLRILPNQSFSVASQQIKSQLFQEEAEHKLGNLYLGFSKKMADLNEKGQYDKLLNNLAELAPAIDHFFDQVLIMTDDPEIKANRLALLSEIADYVYAICDLRELVIAPKSSS